MQSISRVDFSTGTAFLPQAGYSSYNLCTPNSPMTILSETAHCVRNSPKLSFSLWVWWGNLVPGTQGDSCFGTYYTPAAAVRK